MITATCTTSDCQQNGVDYNFRGKPPFVECGGCHVHLEPYDLRDDPPMPEPFED